MQRYSTSMAQIQEQMLVNEYMDSVLALDEKQFIEYYDSLSEEQQEELNEFIGKIAKGIGKIAVAPITLPYKVGKAAVKGVGKAVTSNPAKKAAGLVGKGAAALAKGAGKAAKAAVVNKQGNVRFSTSGRADAAKKKADAIAKRNDERERLAKEKERVAKERERAKKLKGDQGTDARADVAKQQRALDKEKEASKKASAAEIDKEKKEALDDDDKDTVKDIIKGLNKASGLHKKQAKQLTKDIEDETSQVTVDRLKRDKKAAQLKKDIKNIGEEVEDLEEFTDKQIERLRKEYEGLRGKETGINPEKFKKLRGMMMRFPKQNLLKLVKADIPILTTGAKAALVMYHGMKWKSLPEDFLPYIDLFADDNKELNEVKKGKFKEVDPKVIDRIEKMMNGTRAEKDSIANMLNYFMPPEVVDMVRYKLKIVPKRGRIKFR